MDDDTISYGPVIGTTPFFDWIAEKYTPSSNSLEELSHQRIDEHETSLMDRVSAAWKISMAHLTVEQIRLLTSQEIGLEWLAEPVALFVQKYPMAHATFYFGDLSVAALRAFAKILAVAPNFARDMAKVEFNWKDDWKKIDPAFARELDALVTNAKILARGHS